MALKSDAENALPRRPSPGAAGARLAQLYEEHARMVYGVCRLVLRDADEAEDAAQQVFLSAYRSLLAGTEPRNAGAWLGTIARNEARGRLATRPTRPLGLDCGLEPVTISLEEQADARADMAALRSQIAALPGKQREAIVLRDLYGLRYDEVARALNTSRPAVEALLFRGRRRLQRHLRPEIAAGVLVVPLALRESLAYAVPGFATGGASTAGVLAKLAAVPIAAKLAAAGVTVGAVGSAGLIAEQDLRGSRAPAPPAVTVAVEEEAPQARAAAFLPPLTPPRPARAFAAAAEGEDEDLDESRGREDEGADEPEEVERASDDDRDDAEERDQGGRGSDEDDAPAELHVAEPEDHGGEDADEAEESVEADDADSLDEED